MTKSVTKHTIKASITVLTTAGLVLSTNTGAATVAATVNDSGDTNVTKTLSCERIIDHSSSNSDTSLNTNKWYSVNDNVMGGRSVGTFTEHADHLRFHGSINTNGGGFTSIRHDVDARQFTETDRIRLAIQSDGRAYHVTLQDKNNRQQSTSHRLPIPHRPTMTMKLSSYSLKTSSQLFVAARLKLSHSIQQSQVLSGLSLAIL